MSLSERQAEVEALDFTGTGWGHISGDHAAGLEARLRRELSPEHDLFGRVVIAVARSYLQDDVMYVTDDPEFPFAVVHLTWTDHPPETPPFPGTFQYHNIDELMEVFNSMFGRGDASPGE